MPAADMPHPFTIAAREKPAIETIRDAGRRRLPTRYESDLWDKRFKSHLDTLLAPGIAILDIGSGRRPTVGPDARPSDLTYVGLDIDADELAAAGSGAYDEVVTAPVEEPIASLEGRFDVAISFFAFEHVRSTAAALENIRSYLKPGGTLVAQLAGAWSPFSLANRLVPGDVARFLLQRTHERDPETVFPARYDSCRHSALTGLLERSWSEYEVLPLFTGAGYVLFSRVLTAAYIAYEEWAFRRDKRDLAPYYLVRATR
jgi:SAM-dependent methyltransferase